MSIVRSGWRFGGVAGAVVALSLGAVGCELEKAEPPAVNGPSDTGLSVQLRALPDVVNADGVSKSVIELVLRDEVGAPATGRAVEFTANGDGILRPSADSTFVGPIQTGLVMATDSDGVARVVWTAGRRIGRVTVFARAYGIDTSGFGDFFRSVEIQQR